MAWVPSSGSRRGAAHALRSEPSEDSHRTGVVGSTAIVTVADGHGSHRCSRARSGAEFATEVMFEILAEQPPVASQDLPTRIVSGWRAAVDADLTANPPTVGEAAGAPEPHHLLYGTTAIGVCATDTVLRVVQIGDGDVVIGQRGKAAAIRPVVPVAPGSRGETYSLCSADPEPHFGVTDYDLGRVDIDVVLVATDGLGSAFGDPDWHDATLEDLRMRLSRIATTDTPTAVKNWCAAPAATGGDDTTIALLERDAMFVDGFEEKS